MVGSCEKVRNQRQQAAEEIATRDGECGDVSPAGLRSRLWKLVMKAHEETLHLGLGLTEFLSNSFKRLVAEVEGREGFLDEVVSLYAVAGDDLFRLCQRGIVCLTRGCQWVPCLKST